jgi:molecular chaperone DnaJ
MAAQREWFEKDYYKVLGVPESASEKEIKTAFRKLSKQHHPDSGGDEEKFKAVSAAFDVLGDAAKRKEYDEVRRLGPVGQAFGGGGPGFTTNFSTDDLGDLLGGLFNRVRPGGRRSSPNAGPRRGDDLETALHLSFEDAVRGLTTSVNLTSDVVCHSCHGTGAAPGTSPVICATCGGRGVTDENQGFFSFSQPCRDCGGSGMRVETPCPNCRGSGIERRPRQVKVRIPPGVQDGQRIRLKGKGGAGANGGPSGDLYVFVEVGAHQLFGRKGRDLTLNLPLTFAEAALGTTVKVPTLDGPVTLRIPEGTKAGRTFRVKGHGVPAAPNGKPGDLLVSVEVVVPQQLSDEEKAAVEALARASNGSPSIRAHFGVE